jgi:hypothetical protein
MTATTATTAKIGVGLACLGMLLLSPAAAEEVGVALLAQPSVRKTEPGHDRSRPVRQNDPIQFNSTVVTGTGAGFKMRFDLDSGTLTLGAESEMTIDRRTAAGEDRIRVLSPGGRIHLALVGPLRRQVVMESLDGTAPIKDVPRTGLAPRAAAAGLPAAAWAFTPGRGSGFALSLGSFEEPSDGADVRMIAIRDVGTFFAVREGVLTVQSKAGGEPVDVPAGTYTWVARGQLPTPPAPLIRGFDLPPGERIVEDPPLLDCCIAVEPPKPPGP